MKTIIHRIFLVSVIGICGEYYSIKMIWIDFLHTPVSTLYMTLPSNRPGHGLLIVTRKTLLTFAVWVFLFAQWMAASMSVMLYYLMTKDERTVFRNLVGVDYVLLTNAPLLTCLARLIA